MEILGAGEAVERYHTSLRLRYEQIHVNTDHQNSDQEWLRITVFAVNCIIGLEGWCPALLVLVAIPKPVETLLASS